MKHTRTWILIADGAYARILLNDGPGRGVHLVPGLDFSVSHDADHEINADRPGRTFDRLGPGRHAKEPASSPHRLRKAKFAKDLVALLHHKLAEDAFDRLIVVAPPKTLGDLRSEMSKPVLNRISGELAKDLTQIPDRQIARQLEGVLAV